MRAILIVLMLAGAVCSAEARPKKTRQLIVVTAAQLDAANAAAVKAFGRGGEGTFSVPFNDGKNVARPKDVTHYVCSMVLTAEQLAAFRKELDALLKSNKVVLYDKGSRGTLAELKLKPTK